MAIGASSPMDDSVKNVPAILDHDTRRKLRQAETIKKRAAEREQRNKAALARKEALAKFPPPPPMEITTKWVEEFGGTIEDRELTAEEFFQQSAFSVEHVPISESVTYANEMFRDLQPVVAQAHLKEARLELMKKLGSKHPMQSRVNKKDGTLLVNDKEQGQHEASGDKCVESAETEKPKPIDEFSDDSESDANTDKSEDDSDNDEEAVEEVNEDPAYREKVWEQIKMMRAKRGGL